VATNEEGDVVLDRLPRPVIGTFWPYCREAKAKLKSVVAGARLVVTDETALTIPELLEANVGKRARISEGNTEYIATIVSIPSRTPAAPADRNPSGAELAAPVKGDVILFKTNEGHRVVPMSRIQEATFLDEPITTFGKHEIRNLLTLNLEWESGASPARAAVGMAYLEKGMRWIPSYRVTIDGKDRAHVELQATLINEMVDLRGVAVNLVVGVPTFRFRDTLDPLSLQQTAAQLSSYFQEGSRTGFALSNAIMTQTARMQEVRAVAPARAGAESLDSGLELEGASKSEDLFVFKVDDVTLQKGERMVVRVAEFDVPYEDIYTLHMPVLPPLEVRRHFDSSQQAELAKLLHTPKFMHFIRLVNTSRYPLTTAPALILKEGQLIAQGMMTYTARGGASDLALTKATDVRVDHSEREVERTANAIRVNDADYSRVDLAGSVEVTNHLDKPIPIEVVRHVLGKLDEAKPEGKLVSLDWRTENWQENALHDGPPWWTWHSWPWWWRNVNGRGSVSWQATLEPGETATFEYAWHYFWR